MSLEGGFVYLDLAKRKAVVGGWVGGYINISLVLDFFVFACCISFELFFLVPINSKILGGFLYVSFFSLCYVCGYLGENVGIWDGGFLGGVYFYYPGHLVQNF